MLCRHVLIGAAEFAAMEAELTRQAEMRSAQAERIDELERAVHDHRTASLLAGHDDEMAAIDNRLWGVLDDASRVSDP